MPSTGRDNAKKDLIPIGKLKNYLKWRQKEFIEKYEDVWYDEEYPEYCEIKAGHEIGVPLNATIDADLLRWDCKASHPWILIVEVQYDKGKNNGMSEKEILRLLMEIESCIFDELKDNEGYALIGRQFAGGLIQTYLACKEFRKPSKILYKVQSDFKEKLSITFEIIKDKRWRTFDHFKLFFK
ncbi:DUF695 domain-containing protein [Chitinophagaceae bacterium LB-8]|uniref:DUF695 domain-containing protein n=1 Tax=Paraflavisolibacter caeni TaxID=2982496 RepID=A0A9X3BIH9_9BACT|nr:DUF695 domain-containing protein [Paraflavisolibacter caeni]MCU7551392.1 DUF695 domain-containing protein [Paraflavisolibacter caeni]